MPVLALSSSIDPAFAQMQFDKKYITASEIMKEVKISRAALLYARRSGNLPPPSVLTNDGRLYIWERELIQPYLTAWKLALTERRG